MDILIKNKGGNKSNKITTNALSFAEEKMTEMRKEERKTKFSNLKKKSEKVKN